MMDDWDLDGFPTEVLPDDSTEAYNLPLLPVRDTVLFPHVATPLFVGRDRSVKALEAAMAGGQRIAVFAQKDAEVNALTETINCLKKGHHDKSCNVDEADLSWFAEEFRAAEIDIDNDNDGYSDIMGDCDDTDDAVNQDASETCGDEIDNNCDGNIDEGY